MYETNVMTLTMLTMDTKMPHYFVVSWQELNSSTHTLTLTQTHTHTHIFMFELMERTLRTAVVPRLARQCHNQKANGGPHTCGIPPFKDPVKEKKLSLNAPQRIQFKLPGHLIRPPCMPGSELGNANFYFKWYYRFDFEFYILNLQ